VLTVEQIEDTIRLKQYAYQNEQTEDLKGEIWKLIPGFDDAYMMSNLGRVKSLDRTVYRKNGTTLHINECIKKLRIRRVYNVSKYHPGRVAYEVQVGMNVNANKIIVTAARYLYYLFIEKFDLTDSGLFVTAKDGNRLNLSLDNLQLVTVSYVMKREFENGKIRMRYRCKAKKVAQYTLNNEFVAEYPSMTFAARALGIDESAVYRTVTGHIKQTHGFIFKEIK